VENILRKVLTDAGIEFEEAEGEAAFYGPKLDIQAVNVFGKEDTISTIQVDFNLPDRFDLSYIDSNGTKQRPYVIHRALIGSFERFFAFMIEYYRGLFPLWLAPEQVRILPIADAHKEYAEEVKELYQREGIRVTTDLKNDTLGAKIRNAEMEKIPYVLVVGDKEMSTNTVSVRPTGQKELGIVDTEKFLIQLKDEIANKKSRHKTD
jgi:threonyl-tRNA synthetase